MYRVIYNLIFKILLFFDKNSSNIFCDKKNIKLSKIIAFHLCKNVKSKMFILC